MNMKIAFLQKLNEIKIIQLCFLKKLNKTNSAFVLVTASSSFLDYKSEML